MLSELKSNRKQPALIVKLSKKESVQPLRISDIAIEVCVTGKIAQTKMKMSFYNELDRVLEGQFVFPILQGQIVTSFALDIDGKLREGVVVEKTKGRQIFEATIRKQIDPGLLEWTKGNVFQSRIYPIPAKGYRQISIGFQQELNVNEQNLEYILPLNFEEEVDSFSIQAEVFGQDSIPDFSQNQIPNWKFEKTPNSYLAKVKFKNYLPNQELCFVIPRKENQVHIGKWQDGNSYFYANLFLPDVPKRERRLPKKVCLLWDVSDSMKNRDIQKELEFLEGYFTKLQNLSLEVVTFSNQIHSSKLFSISHAKLEELFQYLKNLAYDGGTQFGSLDLFQYLCDEFLLMSDGISNFGESKILFSQTPVISVSSCLTSEHSYLEYIARKTSGVYINLSIVSVQDAIQRVSIQAYSFLSVSYNENEVTEIYPNLPTAVNQNFSFAGILTKSKAEIELHFGFGKEVVYSEDLVLDSSLHKVETNVVPKLWAQKKIAELDVLYEENVAEITQTGKEFSIVTRGTSLIVLDSIDDYVKHRIVPPEEMQKEYVEYIIMQNKEESENQKKHLDRVYRIFQSHIEWWNKEYNDFPKEKSLEKERLMVMEERSFMMEDRTFMEEEDEDISLSGSELDNVMDNDSFAAPAMEVESRMTAPRTYAEIPKTKSKDDREDIPESSIRLKKWNPKTPYLQKLQSADESKWYETYLHEKQEYSDSSAFFLDVADFFLERNRKEFALRILSNIAEMKLENHQLLRILGYRLMQFGEYKLAIKILEEVLKIREEEPQSYRDLGLAHAANKEYQKAIDRLYTVVSKEWDDRFPEIELIALHELNAIIETCGETLNLENIDKRLLKNLPVDIRVVLTWDADNTDIDLWVTDPYKEKCNYSHKETVIGGRMSMDFQQGYGPEEFLLKKAVPGSYLIQANYFGNHQQVIAGATTIQVALITNFGRENQEEKSITMRLKSTKEVIEVGRFDFNE